MTQKTPEYRLDGIYVQRQEGYFMQRVKLAAGVISGQQARMVATIAERFGQGTLHLTTRGSIEIHWLKEEDLAEVKRTLATVGLTSRGACGGAVRGISCASQGAIGFPLLESLARRIHRHFTANPRFERLPKKFKIGIEADSSSKRHLIQDVGLVLKRSEDGRGWYDVWIAGGLGREPQAGILLEADVVEERIIPLIEAVARVYTAGAPAGKRLKHLLNTIGETELRSHIAADPASREELPPVKGFNEVLIPAGTDTATRLEARFFAGMLSSSELRAAADFADQWSQGVLMITTEQNIAFPLTATDDTIAQARKALESSPCYSRHPLAQACFRICPGTHECRAGLSATRDSATVLLNALGSRADSTSMAFSGCANSCTQPQLADIGITTSRLVAAEDGTRTPRFDIWHGSDSGLGQKVHADLTLEELIAGLRLRSANGEEKTSVL